MAASQRARPRVPAPQRSILPPVSGVPAWAAVLIAVACTILGFVIDASGDGADLTGMFATLYVVGCVTAVLAVRHRGLFTTMVLPPLLLFLTVPLAYMQLTGRTTTSIKDILLNLAIPLVNRFPTMMLATTLVLAIGCARILVQRRGESTTRAEAARRGGRGGRTQSKRSRPGWDERTGKDGTEAARRRTRRPQPGPDAHGPENDEQIPRLNRRPATQVADAPPRVATGARPREGRPARGGTRPTPAVPRPEPEPPRSAAARRRTEVPPHPQPNVRYRERDSNRTERRRPDGL